MDGGAVLLLPPVLRSCLLVLQICAISEELLKTEYDAMRIVYNRFGSAVSFKPTIATVLSPDVSLLARLYVPTCVQ